MPDTPINTAQPLRLEQGGLFRLVDIADASAAYEVQNREKGTVQLKDGWYQPLRYTNKGEMQVPVEGDEQPSTLRATLKLTSMEADELLTISQQRNTADGKLRRFTVELQWPEYKGGAVLWSAILTNACFISPVEITEGQEFDTVTLEMESSEPKWLLGEA